MKKILILLIFPCLLQLLCTLKVVANDGNLANKKISAEKYTLNSGKNKPTHVRFSFEYGRIISSFAYLNSEGEKLDNLLGSTNNHVAIGGKIQIKRTNFYLLSTISFNTYAATGSDNLVGNYYDWKVNYLGTNVGLGYEFFRFSGYRNSANISEHKGFTLYTQVAIATEFLIQGTQTINNQVYNLIGVEQFDKPFLFTRGGIGAVYYASKAMSVYAQYMGGMGFPVIKSASDQEKLNYVTHTISFGVQITLPSF